MGRSVCFCVYVCVCVRTCQSASFPVRLRAYITLPCTVCAASLSISVDVRVSACVSSCGSVDSSFVCLCGHDITVYCKFVCVKNRGGVLYVWRGAFTLQQCNYALIAVDRWMGEVDHLIILVCERPELHLNNYRLLKSVIGYDWPLHCHCAAATANCATIQMLHFGETANREKRHEK